MSALHYNAAEDLLRIRCALASFPGLNPNGWPSPRGIRLCGSSVW